MNLLQAQALCKTYGTGETAVQALKDVSFSVPKGEFVAVVGESGSGKSTLLNLLGGLDTPTSGKVLLDGRDLFAMKERERTIFRRRNIASGSPPITATRSTLPPPAFVNFCASMSIASERCTVTTAPVTARVFKKSLLSIGPFQIINC